MGTTQAHTNAFAPCGPAPVIPKVTRGASKDSGPQLSIFSIFMFSVYPSCSLLQSQPCGMGFQRLPALSLASPLFLWCAVPPPPPPVTVSNAILRPCVIP